MKTCPNCGAFNEDSDLKCIVCGQDISTVRPPGTSGASHGGTGSGSSAGGSIGGSSGGSNGGSSGTGSSGSSGGGSSGRSGSSSTGTGGRSKVWGWVLLVVLSVAAGILLLLLPPSSRGKNTGRPADAASGTPEQTASGWTFEESNRPQSQAGTATEDSWMDYAPEGFNAEDDADAVEDSWQDDAAAVAVDPLLSAPGSRTLEGILFRDMLEDRGRNGWSAFVDFYIDPMPEFTDAQALSLDVGDYVGRQRIFEISPLLEDDCISINEGDIILAPTFDDTWAVMYAGDEGSVRGVQTLEVQIPKDAVFYYEGPDLDDPDLDWIEGKRSSPFALMFSDEYDALVYFELEDGKVVRMSRYW